MANHVKLCALGMIIAVGISVPAAGQAGIVTEVRLDYRCEIPRNLPPQLILTEKDNSQTTVDATETYRIAHRQGWFWVVHGYVTSGGKFPGKPGAVQEWAFNSKAREVGILEAKAAICKMLLTHDTDTVASALKKQYPSWDDGFFPLPKEWDEKQGRPDKKRLKN